MNLNWKKLLLNIGITAGGALLANYHPDWLKTIIGFTGLVNGVAPSPISRKKLA